MKFYGWPVSPYTEKTRAWLRFKGLGAEEITPSLWRMRRTTMPAVGRFVMPVVQLDDGRWLDDSQHILDTLESEHPAVPSEPSTPRQRVASALLHLFGDEWLILAALHYRWNLPDNATFAISEFAKFGLPWVPGFVGRRLMKRVAGRMSAYRPKFGVVPATTAGIEGRTVELIAAMERHLSVHDYFLGSRPCMGDFAVFGSLWAHLQRDVHSTFLFDEAPAVLRWTARLRKGASTEGEYLPGDAIPDSLGPVLRLAVADPWRYLRDVLQATETWCREHPDATRVPRALGDTPFEVGGCHGERRLVTFHAWKAQRVLDRLEACDDDDRAWVDGLGAFPLSELPMPPRQAFVGHRLVLAS